MLLLALAACCFLSSHVDRPEAADAGPRPL
jgi:hypothetical protein